MSQMTTNHISMAQSGRDSVPTLRAMDRQPHSAELLLSDEQVRAVQLILTALLGRWGGKRKWIYNVAQQLAALGGLREGPWPSTGRAFNAIGLSPDELGLLATSGDRCLSVEILAAFIPLELWPIVWELIEQGPRVAARRVEAVYRAWAKGLTPTKKRRKNGPLGAETIELHITAFWALIEELNELNKDKAHPAFRRWRESNKPRRLRPRKLGAKSSRREVMAPEQLIARRAIRLLDQQVREQKRTNRGRETLFRVLRNRAIIALFLLLGGRKEEIASLLVSDFRENYPFADGAGPAIIIRPDKTDLGLERAKALPEIVADWIRDYLAYTGHGDQPHFPLWLPNRSKSIASGKELDAQQIAQVVLNAFKPFCDRRVPPRALRHLAAKLSYDFGNQWTEENKQQIRLDDRLPRAAQTFADVLLDHALRDVADLYNEVGSEHGRERWGRLASLGVWERIWGDAGARQGPDIERIATAQRHLAEREALARSVRDRIDNLRNQKNALRAGADGTDDTNELLRLTLRISGIDDEITLALERLLDVQATVQVGEDELRQAYEAEISVPDDMSEEELEALTSSAQTPEIAAEETRPVVRYECTPEEFRQAYGKELLSRSSMNRYIRGLLPHPAGDARNLFEPNPNGGRPECVIEVSQRDVRIRLDLVDWARFPIEIQERLDELMRTPWPKRRGHRFIPPAPLDDVETDRGDQHKAA
jgi:hypothetical protein